MRRTLNPLRLLTVPLLVIAACDDKDEPCKDGYGRASDGRCYPIDEGEEDAVIQSVEIGPDTVRTNDTLLSVVVLDGDRIDTGLAWEDYPVRYTWFVDGEEVTGTANHLHGWKYFTKGQVVSLVVSDLEEGGASMPSNSVTVLNTPPPAPRVSIEPANPYAGVDSLKCVIEALPDIDEDELTYNIEWRLNGVGWSAVPPAPPMDDGGDPPGYDTGDLPPPPPPPEPDEVPASNTAGGQQWECIVSAFDGEEWSVEGQADVSIQADFTGWPTDSFPLEESDYIFVGENPGDVAGASLTGVGDVDGDGKGDFLIPAYFNDDGADDGGKVYLVRAQDLDGPGEYALADMPFQFTGQTDTEEAGHASSSAGDIDGDGLDDLLICGYRNDDPSFDIGRVYVILAASLGEPGIRSTSTADYTFVGEAAEDRLGHSIANAGDLDGDGLEDLIIGSYGNDEAGFDAGKTYVVPGSSLTAPGEIAVGSDQYMFLGENEDDVSGHAVRGAWDVDGDGLNDFVIGARRNDTGADDGGKMYLILGDSLGAPGDVQSLTDADHGFYGTIDGGWVGYQVAGAGDVDGDGLGDIMVGAHMSVEGRVYLVYASSIGSAESSLDDADVTFVGRYPSDQSGRSISAGGDVDADGLADVLIGARNAADRYGRAHLVLGADMADGMYELTDSTLTFLGEERLDEAGYTVSSPGDVNGDGLGDVLIGAWQGDFDDPDSAGTGPGRAYLILAPTE